MKKKLNIPKDFWKDFKDRKDFDELFGEFDPKPVPMHETRLSDEKAEIIMGLYSRGMSTTDIQEQIDQIYGVQVDSSNASNITNTLLEKECRWLTSTLLQVFP